jgi:hypothetical protein
MDGDLDRAVIELALGDPVALPTGFELGFFDGVAL